MNVVLAVAFGLALSFWAGCLEEPAEATVLPPPEPDDGRVARQGRGGGGEARDEDRQQERSGNLTLRTFRDTFGLTLTGAYAVLDVSSIDGYNCVLVEGAPFTVLDGTATVTWTPGSQLTESLDVTAQTYYGESEERASGRSPLVLEFEDLELEDEQSPDVLEVAIHLAGPAGAAFQQQAQLDLAFDYESDIDVDVGLGYC